MALPAGTPVPEFRLVREDRSELTHAHLADRTVVLVFYPFAFSPVCTDQLNVYEEVLGELRERGAEIYGVSVDSIWAQKAFKAHLGITIEQLSDFEPKGETCRALGVYHPGGFAQRALVVTGPDGRVAWSYEAPTLDELPGANLIFDGLAAAAPAN